MQCKNLLFARQKGGFYTPKKTFLFFVSITNTLLMCYEYSVKWLRTPTKCARKHTKHPTNTHEKSNEQSMKCPRNTPSGVGADSSRPYPYIIKYTYWFHQIRISVSSYTNIHIIKYAFTFPISWMFIYTRAR